MSERYQERRAGFDTACSVRGRKEAGHSRIHHCVAQRPQPSNVAHQKARKARSSCGCCAWLLTGSALRQGAGSSPC